LTIRPQNCGEVRSLSLYLHWFDALFYGPQGPARRDDIKLVHYADDFVALAKQMGSDTIEFTGSRLFQSTDSTENPSERVLSPSDEPSYRRKHNHRKHNRSDLAEYSLVFVTPSCS
jgi:hypothetical protein